MVGILKHKDLNNYDNDGDSYDRNIEIIRHSLECACNKLYIEMLNCVQVFLTNNSLNFYSLLRMIYNGHMQFHNSNSFMHILICCL